MHLCFVYGMASVQHDMDFSWCCYLLLPEVYRSWCVMSLVWLILDNQADCVEQDCESLVFSTAT